MIGDGALTKLETMRVALATALKERDYVRADLSRLREAADALQLRAEKAESELATARENYRERMFPVLQEGWSFPWRYVAPFEAQAQRNHGQSLSRLAERGGLCSVELLCVVNDLAWRERIGPDDTARERFTAWVRAQEDRDLSRLREAARLAGNGLIDARAIAVDFACFNTGSGPPAGDCACSVCETVRDVDRALATLRSCGIGGAE